MLVGTLTFAKGRSIPYHVENVIPTEGKTDIFRIAIQRGQGGAAAFAGAQGSHPDGGADQGARFVAMDTLQRL